MINRQLQLHHKIYLKNKNKIKINPARRCSLGSPALTSPERNEVQGIKCNAVRSAMGGAIIIRIKCNSACPAHSHH
jgi:hypothetical protein